VDCRRNAVKFFIGIRRTRVLHSGLGGICLRNIARRTTIRAAGLTLMALTTGLTVSWADVIQSTVVLPPVSGAYTLGGVCVSGVSRCTENATVSGFNIMTDTELSGNELVSVGANYSADVFTDSGGSPGTFLGHLSLSGTAQFTYVGRNPGVNPLGTFATDLTSFDFTGTLNGNTFEIKQDPGDPSTGSTTILESTFVPPIEFTVSGSLDIFAQFSFNGAPFVSAPERMTTLSAVPEPGLGGLVLAGVLGIAWRRRRVR
jgi:hypothetical protein